MLHKARLKAAKFCWQGGDLLLGGLLGKPPTPVIDASAAIRLPDRLRDHAQFCLGAFDGPPAKAEPVQIFV